MINIINTGYSLRYKLAAALLLFSLSLGSIGIFAALTASAQTVSNPCDTKIPEHEIKCNASLKKRCPATASPEIRNECISNFAKKYSAAYTDVYKVCRSADDPQACYKTVKKKCSGKTGEALEACKEKQAKQAGAKASASAGDVSLAAKGDSKDTCGEGENAVETKFDFGCQEVGSPIEDLAYSLIRFLSFGVGLVLVASIIYAGIQYSSSEGSPEATMAAKKRIQNAIIGLVFYLFIFAFVQYLVPGGLFAP